MIYGTENHPIRGVRIRITSTFGTRCGKCFQYLAFLLPGTSITIPLFYSPLGKVSGLWAWHWTRPWPRIGTISLWTRIDCWPPCAPPTSRDSADVCVLTTAASGWAWCRYCSGATVCGTRTYSLITHPPSPKPQVPTPPWATMTRRRTNFICAKAPAGRRPWTALWCTDAASMSAPPWRWPCALWPCWAFALRWHSSASTSNTAITGKSNRETDQSNHLHNIPINMIGPEKDPIRPNYLRILISLISYPRVCLSPYQISLISPLGLTNFFF